MFEAYSNPLHLLLILGIAPSVKPEEPAELGRGLWRRTPWSQIGSERTWGLFESKETLKRRRGWLMGAYIERNHRSGEKTHVQDVGGGCDDCRNNNDDEYGGVWLVNSKRRSGLAYAATCRCKTPTVNPDVQPIWTRKVSRDCSSEEIFIGSGNKRSTSEVPHIPGTKS